MSALGGEMDYAFIHGKANDFKIGLKAGAVQVDGMNEVLYLIPVATDSLKTWGYGPTLSYYHYFKSGIGLGFEGSYLQTLPAQVTTHTVLNTNFTSSNRVSFGVYDVLFGLQVRFL